MIECLVSFGSNLGDRIESWRQAAARLADDGALHGLRWSQPRWTRAIVLEGRQDDYLNAVVRLSTSLEAERLLERLAAIEGALGRRRAQRWGARTADLDLLLYGRQIIDRADGERGGLLQVPHPRMSHRRFVLEAAEEIAADWVHPLCGLSVRQLRERIDRSPWTVALAGPAAWSSQLAATMRERPAPAAPDGEGAWRWVETHGAESCDRGGGATIAWCVLSLDDLRVGAAAGVSLCVVPDASMLLEGAACGRPIGAPYLVLQGREPSRARQELSAAVRSLLPHSVVRPGEACPNFSPV